MTNSQPIDLSDPGCQASLRLEQRYFEAFNQQASDLEARVQAELTVSHQRAEALQQSLEQQHHTLHLQLHQQEQDLELCRTQLVQAQDELEFNVAYLQNLEQFQHRASHSFKAQLMLISKNLLRRLADRLRWHLPAERLRHHKERLRALLQQL